VPHGNPVVDGNGIKFSRKVSGLINDLFYLLTNVVQVGMTGNELSK